MQIFTLIKESAQDFLEGFSLDVVGVACGVGVKALSVKYQSSDAEALETKIAEMADNFVYKGSRLDIVTVEQPDAFIPPDGIFHPPARAASAGPPAWPMPPNMPMFQPVLAAPVQAAAVLF